MEWDAFTATFHSPKEINPKKTDHFSSEGSKDFELPSGTDDEVPKEDGERKGERQDEAAERCLWPAEGGDAWCQDNHQGGERHKGEKPTLEHFQISEDFHVLQVSNLQNIDDKKL